MTKHGDIEHDSKKAKGYGSDALTESEARHLANDKPAQAVRDRIIEEGDAAVSRRNGQDAGSIKKPLPNPPLIREGSEESAPSYPSPDKGRLGGVSSLPLGWTKVEIGELAQVVGGGTPKANDDSNFVAPGKGIAWLTPADLSGYKYKEIAFGKRDLSEKGLKSSSAKLMPKGSILFSSRAPIGYVAISQNEISTNQGFKSFVFPECVEPSYAYHYLKSIRSLAESLGTGTTFKELSTTAARKLPFILPPLPEQIRIANKLDSILAKVDNAQARLEKIPTLLKRFRQAVLAAATSGELTREWREDEDCDYAERIFGGLILELKNGLSPKPNENAEGYPILRINAIRSGKVFQDDIRYLACEKKTLDTYKIKVGDLLFTRYNGSLEFVGVCGLVRELKHEYLLYPDKLMRVRLTHEVLPEYAELYFASSEARRSVTDCVKTTSGQKGISGKDIKEQKILLPDIEEQGEIVRRVESLFALADSVEKQYKAAKQRLDRLTQAVLAKAFRGELVPQDPDDEPAAELLKRIQAQRTQQQTGKKRHAAS